MGRGEGLKHQVFVATLQEGMSYAEDGALYLIHVTDRLSCHPIYTVKRVKACARGEHHSNIPQGLVAYLA
jgi:hypothetical protein